MQMEAYFRYYISQIIQFVCLTEGSDVYPPLKLKHEIFTTQTVSFMRPLGIYIVAV